LRLTTVLWMLMTGAAALPLPAFREAAARGTPESWTEAVVSLALGALAASAILACRRHATGLIAALVGFQAVGLAAPDPIGIGLMAGLFLTLRLFGLIKV
jgi:hypothetical protein